VWVELGQPDLSVALFFVLARTPHALTASDNLPISNMATTVTLIEAAKNKTKLPYKVRSSFWAPLSLVWAKHEALNLDPSHPNNFPHIDNIALARMGRVKGILRYVWSVLAQTRYRICRVVPHRVPLSSLTL
jgi:hypothetical protein